MGPYGLMTVIVLFSRLISPDNFVVEWNGETLATVHRSDYALLQPGIPLINEKKFQKFLDKIGQKVYLAPVNAGLDDLGRIIPEQMGRKLDRRLLMEQFYRFIYEGGSSKIEVPQRPSFPKVDRELLSIIREKQIGQYITYFNPRNRNRSQNIVLAARAVNNQVLFPGEKFSFNQVVGIRTESKGFKRAHVIVKGEIAEGVGGGICQISSTLFNAVDRAGLRIIERYSHSRNVPYVPPGRDATVSWGGPDLVFQNKYNQPIFIRALVYGGQIQVLIYSSEGVNYKSRGVPSASEQLPEEIFSDSYQLDIQQFNTGG
ncbi:VanW family protein [Paenibacillus terrigena]|uniref:VanW family protein n=1 Tax=Paenibacillus terrigena TaxID=369333 RepID=UPI0028D657B7|nr:VanW family protein [Paenibacillus terrigena]